MKGEVDEPECEHSPPRVPKKEVAINPINPHGGLGMLALAPAENRVYLTQFSSVRGRV